MEKTIRVDGIYDLKTLETARSLGLNLFQFDFRPKSFNFLQQHIFLDMLSKGILPSETFFLHYSNEKDFVILKMLEDLKGVISSGKSSDQVFLEFSDERESSYYDQFDVPFYWSFNLGKSIEEVLKTYNLRGIIWDLSLMEDIHQRYGLENFLPHFLDQYGENIRRMKLQMVLRVGRSLKLLPLLFQLLPFDFISLPIDSSLELSYRNVNFEHFKKEVHFLDELVSSDPSSLGA
jgi:hypothetical protein